MASKKKTPICRVLDEGFASVQLEGATKDEMEKRIFWLYWRELGR
ncbi:unnamed protein product [Rhodiola kirilowii]